MRKLVFNKKFLAAVGIVLAVGGCFFVKGRMNTKAADDSIFVQNMSVQYKQCEGTSKEILEEGLITLGGGQDRKSTRLNSSH